MNPQAHYRSRPPGLAKSPFVAPGAQALVGAARREA